MSLIFLIVLTRTHFRLLDADGGGSLTYDELLGGEELEQFKAERDKHSELQNENTNSAGSEIAALVEYSDDKPEENCDITVKSDYIAALSNVTDSSSYAAKSADSEDQNTLTVVPKSPSKQREHDIEIIEMIENNAEDLLLDSKINKPVKVNTGFFTDQNPVSRPSSAAVIAGATDR